MFNKRIESQEKISFLREVATTKMEGGGPSLLEVCPGHRGGVGPGAHTSATAKETEEDKVHGQRTGKVTAVRKMQLKLDAECVDEFQCARCSQTNELFL